MNQTQADRLMKLANFLEQLPENEFEYGTIREIRTEAENELDEQVDLLNPKANYLSPITCNTVACALGWCPNIFKEFTVEEQEITLQEVIDQGSIDIVILYDGDDATDSDYNYSEGEDVYKASKFFGISNDDYYDLFLNSYSYYHRGEYTEVTKAMVVNRIHNLLNAGGYKVV